MASNNPPDSPPFGLFLLLAGSYICGVTTLALTTILLLQLVGVVTIILSAPGLAAMLGHWSRR